MDEYRRVVITGIGVISPIGIGREPFWEGFRRGSRRSGRSPGSIPSPFKSRIAAR